MEQFFIGNFVESLLLNSVHDLALLEFSINFVKLGLYFKIILDDKPVDVKTDLHFVRVHKVVKTVILIWRPELFEVGSIFHEYQSPLLKKRKEFWVFTRVEMFL